MHRRDALRSLTGLLGAAVAIPSWAQAWTPSALEEPKLLGSTQKKVLTGMVDAILPKTDTPGAAELGVQRFVELMVQDCYEGPQRDRLKDGLDRLEAEAKNSKGKNFADLKGTERLELIQKWASGPDKSNRDFTQLVKDLTIHGYVNSEYVMTHITKYELVPARYLGCVPV